LITYKAFELLKIHAMKKLLQISLRLFFLIIALSFFLCLKAASQNLRLIDSLKNVVASARDDTNKVKLFYTLGEQYRYTIIDTAIYYYQQALDISEKIDSKKFTAQCLIAVGANLQRNGLSDKAIECLERALSISEEIGDKVKISTSSLNIGIIKHDQGLYDTAIEYYLKSLETAKEIDFKIGESRSYNNLGRAYFDQGLYDESIDNYLKALKIQEELGDKRGMSASYNNIGLIHKEQGSYDKAIEYLKKAIAIHEELGEKRGMSICYLNVGDIYVIVDSSNKAIEYHSRALKQFEELGEKEGISKSNHSLGDDYVKQGSYDKANEYFLRALKVYEEIGDKMGIALLGISLANLNISMADSEASNENRRLNYLNQAVAYGNKSILNAREMKLLPATKEAANSLMTAYNKLGNYKKAIEFAGILITTQDSIFRQDKTRAIQEMSTRYETEKKQQQIELQESQLTVKDAKIKQQRTFRNALIGGLGAIILIVIVIANAYAQKRKDNKKIKEQNGKIIRANEELKQLNVELKQLNETTIKQKDEIISSILYAQKIQSAILPPEGYITELLNENFIFYKPKDIVSGDFYWIKQVKQYIVLVSADCTGHGVPAAFMSMLGISYLNEIVQSREVTQANQILNELRKQIKHSLRQSGKKEETRDGIDLALCVIDSKKNTMQYSGAHNPLYIIKHHNGESVLNEIKADPMPVGMHFSSDISFTNHEIQIEVGDTFYIFSDGFIDQGGGNDNIRFTSARFKKLLLEIHDQPMPEQKEILDQTLRDWMGSYPQRDDILVIGARV
jgi:serine phosphatase RsbU (regulator of sigma subunit)/tetratricopeptide (TPR) repeat protein